MDKQPNPIHHAPIQWQTDAQGRPIPISCAFDDVYFSKQDGLAESQYVFIAQNRLAERFHALFNHENEHHDEQYHHEHRHHFVIGETGFGTGLNFLAVCALWQKLSCQYPNAHPKTLYFVSTEKYPLSQDNLSQALHIWQDEPSINAFAEQLIGQYPVAVAGCHRRHFQTGNQHRLVLDLWLGDASDSLASLADSCPKVVDAWFLDGFAPSKNHALWSETLFAHIAKLSHQGTTLATFSAAGQLRRQLLAIGASPSKVKGFGKKREMLRASFDHIAHHHTVHRNTTRHNTTHHNTPSNPPKPKAIRTALVIGAGVCGLMSAYALACRGIKVTLLDKVAPLAGASGNPCALLSPKLTAVQHTHDNLSTMGFLYAHHHYHHLNRTSTQPIFYQTGVVDFLLPTRKAAEQLADWVASFPDTLINQHKRLTSQDFHAFLPLSGLVLPPVLAQHILSHANIEFCCADIKQLCTHTSHAIAHHAHGQYTGDIAIVCAGFESHRIHPAIYQARSIRGQLSWLCDKHLSTQLQRHHSVLKYDGYACVLPTCPETVLFGASFGRNDHSCDIRPSEHQANWDKLQAKLSDFDNQLDDRPNISDINCHAIQGRASIRSQTPDYHPMVGRLEHRLYVMSATGSKGFSVAGLCAESLMAQIFDEPMPITHHLVQKLAPNRPRLQIPLAQDD